jgi:hypothetical protein
VVPYKIESDKPYAPEARVGESPGRAFPQTLRGVRASNAAQAGNATRIPACAAFSVSSGSLVTAASGRTATIGTFPVLAYIRDPSGAEVTPPIVITGPQIFRFGAVCKGVRLESMTAPNGKDECFDVTFDPDPAGEWSLAGNEGSEAFVPGTSVLAFTNFNASVLTVTPVVLPKGCRSLMFLATCTTFGSSTVLYGFIDLPRPATGDWFRLAVRIAGAAANARGIGFIGDEHTQQGSGAAVVDATLDNLAVTLSTNLLHLPHMPRSTRVGVYDTAASNRWAGEIVAY